MEPNTAKLGLYSVTLDISAESESIAYQILGVAIKKKFKKERGEGIREPDNFRDIAGAKWK